MSMSVKDIREWLESIPDDEQIGIDDGGLALRMNSDPDIYCEVGGIPSVEPVEIISVTEVA